MSLWDLNLGKRNSNIHTLPTNQAPVDMNSRDSLFCSPKNHYDCNRKSRHTAITVCQRIRARQGSTE